MWSLHFKLLEWRFRRQVHIYLATEQWHNLRGSPDFFRCLYGLRSQGQLLHALYFATGRPKEVLVEGAERLGAVWLNADVDEHLILYSFGQRQQLVQLVGMELTSEHFEDVELCHLANVEKWQTEAARGRCPPNSRKYLGR